MFSFLNPVRWSSSEKSMMSFRVNRSGFISPR